MRPILFPCHSCHRHVDVRHTTCPFCSAALPEGFGASAVPPLGSRRLDRIATFTFALSLAAAAAACGAVKDERTDNGSDAGGSTPDAGGRDGGLIDPNDAGGVRDARVDANVSDGRVDDDGGVMAEYGQPPDDAGIQPIYGLSPLPDD